MFHFLHVSFFLKIAVGSPDPQRKTAPQVWALQPTPSCIITWRNLLLNKKQRVTQTVNPTKSCIWKLLFSPNPRNNFSPCPVGTLPISFSASIYVLSGLSSFIDVPVVKIRISWVEYPAKSQLKETCAPPLLNIALVTEPCIGRWQRGFKQVLRSEELEMLCQEVMTVDVVLHLSLAWAAVWCVISLELCQGQCRPQFAELQHPCCAFLWFSSLWSDSRLWRWFASCVRKSFHCFTGLQNFSCFIECVCADDQRWCLLFTIFNLRPQIWTGKTQRKRLGVLYGISWRYSDNSCCVPKDSELVQ